MQALLHRANRPALREFQRYSIKINMHIKYIDNWEIKLYPVSEFLEAQRRQCGVHMTIHEVQKPQSLRPFLALWTGQAISLFGSQLVQFAIIWWLTEQTGSASILAIASIVGLVPQVLLGPFVGVLVDRWNRRRILLISDAAVASVSLLLAFMYFTGMVEIWHVYLALFIRALGGAFHWPAMTASTSLMVPQDQLTRMQGLNQILNGGLNIVSAPIGALMVAALPMYQVLLIDVLTAVVAIGAVFVIRIPQPRKRETHESAQSSLRAYWSDMRAGLRYMVNWRGLMMLAGLAMFVNLVLAPANSFMPLLVTEHFHGQAWHLGVLESAFGVGVVLGGLLLGIWGGFKNRIVTSMMGLTGIGLGILIVGLTPVSLFPLAIFGMWLSGVMGSLTDGPIFAIFQSKVDPAMQGRVFSLVGSMVQVMTPLGLAVSGPIADLVGIRLWIILGGAFTTVVGISTFFIPTLMNLENERDDFVEVGQAVPTKMSAALETTGNAR